MTVLQIAQLFGLVLAGLGVLAGGVGYLWQVSKKAGRQERADVVETSDTITEFWKGQAEKLNEILLTKDTEFNKKLDDVKKDFNGQMQILQKEVGTLTGQLNAEKSMNAKLETIFANRDPQTQEFMKLLTTAAISSQKFMEEWKSEEKQKMTMWEGMIGALDKIHKIVKNTNQIVDARKMPVKIEGTIQSDTPPIGNLEGAVS